MHADIGLIGLAVMGENLVMNMASKGFTVAVYNRSKEKVERFMAGRAAGRRIIGTYSLSELADSLKRPRVVMMMVKAGAPVDQTMEAILPYLEPGDVLIDGGNSHFPDTQRRMEHAKAAGIHYVGTGVSGGEEGALKGPSIMPGGDPAAWPIIAPIFQSISAQVDGTPCCDWVGKGGAGHFVKMVHNGIEYGDMQIISEAYQLMRDALLMDNEAMGATVEGWAKGPLDSYLIDITRDILRFKDAAGRYVVDDILDTAGQKGTGKWTAQAALDEGVALTLISEAVFARSLSAKKEERVRASAVLKGPKPAFDGDRDAFLADLEQALYASKIISYAQGYALMRAAGERYGWALNYGGIALMWRGGCIIRSVFLNDIHRAFERDGNLENLMLDPFFAEALNRAEGSLRRVVAEAAKLGIPVSAMGAALSYYDGYRTGRLSANLLQAQRDYFGAHSYERVDAPRGEFHHTNWTGEGGDTAASTYDA